MQEAIALSMIEAAKIFGSRGSGYVTRGNCLDRNPVAEAEAGRGLVLTAVKSDGKIKTGKTPVRPIPKRELWFEKAWNTYKQIKEGKR